MSVENRSPRGAILPPRPVKHPAGPNPALQLVGGADAFMTDLITAAAQQNNSPVITGVNNTISGDAGIDLQAGVLLSDEPQQPSWINYYQSSECFYGERDSAPRMVERTSPQTATEVLTDQMIQHEEIITESATMVGKKNCTRKEWESLVCRECINGKHLDKHRENSGKEYKGHLGALACRQIGCGTWTASLWRSDFVRSDDCTHRQNVGDGSSSVSLPEVPASIRVQNLQMQRYRLRRPNAESKQPRNQLPKVVKHLLPPLRTRTGKFMKRPSQQSKTKILEKIGSPSKGESVQYEQASAFEERLSRLPSGVVVTNGQARQGLESFNLDILNTYQGRHIEENLVAKSWGRFMNKISEFDKSVRAVASNEEMRNNLRFLDHVMPLSDLQEIAEESKSPEEHDDSSRLLLVLKTMFKVPIYTSLYSAIPDQVRQLKFPFVLRATLAYLLHLKIFCAQGRRIEWQEMQKRAIKICGEQQGAALFQYLRLGAIHSEDFQWSLKHRAKEYAHSIHTILLPLCQWAESASRTNQDLKKQLELLTHLTYSCLRLSTELHAREGTFNFVWPTYGDRFVPDLYNVDSSQVDSIAAMTDEVLGRQVIAFTLMPAVQRVLAYEDRVMTDAQGVVLLQQPFAE